MNSTQLTLAIVASLAVFAILFSVMFFGFYLLSREKPANNTNTGHSFTHIPVTQTFGPTRSQRALNVLKSFLRSTGRQARIWLPVLASFVKDCGLKVFSAIGKRVPRRLAALTQTIAPPFPEELVWRIAHCHRPLHAAGHLVIVSDYPDGKSRAVLRPRTRLNQRVDLGELDTSPAADLEFLRLAKVHRVS